MSNRMNAEFYQGFSVGVASLCRRDEPALALDVMDTNGVTLADLEAARVEPFDLQPISKAWKADGRRARSSRERGTR